MPRKELGYPTTRAGRARRSEEHKARRAAHREKLWQKVDLILDAIQVGCPKTCRLKHGARGDEKVQHLQATSGRDLKDLSIAYGILLDKYRLETGSSDAGSADIDEFLDAMAGTPPPSKVKQSRENPLGPSARKKVAKVVAAVTH